MNFEIPKLAWLKAVMMAAAKKDIRHYLNGVMIRNGELVATNGHMMILIKSKSIESDGEYIINSDTLEMILLSHKGVKGSNPVIVVGGLSITGKNKVQIEAWDSKYPDVHRAIPDKTSNETAHFNYKYLLALQKANSKFLGGNNLYIKLQHNGLSGAKFESEDKKGNKLIGVVMPVEI